MIKHKIEFLVGAFIILGIASFLMILLQLSDVQSIYKTTKEYKINATFKNIGNLKKKAKVTIGGVKIGNVSRIELKKNSEQEYYPEVEMSINGTINEIPIDSSINILMSSLLGDSYIQIELGNENFFLKDGDTVTLTTQALILEDLISKFTFNK